MKTLLGHRYGTHGTTSVISFLSRFSQQVVRGCPIWAWHLLISESTLGTPVRLHFAPTAFAIAGVMRTREAFVFRVLMMAQGPHRGWRTLRGSDRALRHEWRSALV